MLSTTLSPTTTISPLLTTSVIDNDAGVPRVSQLWEVIVVAASPVVLVFCFCFCIVCLLFRRHEQLAAPVARINVRRSPFANILRQLPPPPKYDVAIASTPPPPLYSDAEKGVVFDPLSSFVQTRRHQQQQNSMSIQYLYPPRYDAQSEPVKETRTESNPPQYTEATSQTTEDVEAAQSTQDLVPPTTDAQDVPSTSSHTVVQVSE